MSLPSGRLILSWLHRAVLASGCASIAQGCLKDALLSSKLRRRARPSAPLNVGSTRQQEDLQIDARLYLR